MSHWNRTEKSSSAHEADLSPPESGSRAQLKREIAGLSYAEQVQRLKPPRPAVQARFDEATELGADRMRSAAASGLKGPPRRLPHLEKIQRSFGGHDVTHIKAHVGGPAAEASSAMGAEAYASGDDVAFKNSPDLHTAAHEAAHVVQQRDGVSLRGGIGVAGDRYEEEADRVADLVVQGKSAEGLLNGLTGARASGGVGGSRKAVQFKKLPPQKRWPETKAEMRWELIDDAVHAGAREKNEYGMTAKLWNAARSLTSFGQTHNSTVPKASTSVEAGSTKIKQKVEDLKFIIALHHDQTLPIAFQQNKKFLKTMDADTNQRMSQYIKALGTHETTYNTKHLDIVSSMHKIAGFQDRMKAAMSKKKSQLTTEQRKKAKEKYDNVKGKISEEIAKASGAYGGAVDGIIEDLPTLALNPTGAIKNLLVNLGKGLAGRFIGEVISLQVQEKYEKQLKAAKTKLAELDQLKSDYIIAEFQADISAYTEFIASQRVLIKKYRIQARKALKDYFFTMTQLKDLEKTWREKFGPKLTKRESGKLEKEYRDPRKRYKQYQFNLFGTVLQVKAELDNEGKELLEAIEQVENDLKNSGGADYHDSLGRTMKWWDKVTDWVNKYAAYGGGHKWVRPYDYINSRVKYSRWVDNGISNYVRFLAKTKQEILNGAHLQGIGVFYKELYKEMAKGTPQP